MFSNTINTSEILFKYVMVWLKHLYIAYAEVIIKNISSLNVKKCYTYLTM